MNLLRRLLPGIALVAGTFLLSVGIQALAAWSAPSGSPPSSNAYAPLNTGPTAQTKSGNLNVAGSVGVGTGAASPGVRLRVISNDMGTSDADVGGDYSIFADYQGKQLFSVKNDGNTGLSASGGKVVIGGPSNNTNTAKLRVISNDLGPSAYNIFADYNGTALFNVGNNGNVGIGTFPSTEKLEVAGHVQVDAFSSGQGGMIRLKGNNGAPDVHLDNYSGYFRVINSNYSADLFHVDQNGYVSALDYYIQSIGRWASSFSDVRLKKDIRPLVNVLDKLPNIRGVSFNWNDAYAALGHPNDERQIGVIAQEVETQFPELVVTASSTDGYKRVNYEGFTAVLLEGMKEQQSEIELLKARIDALEKK